MVQLYKLSRKVLFLLSGIFFLNIMDIYTTYVLLNLGGQEINPFFSYFNTAGIDIISIIFKVLSVAIICVVSYLTFWRADIENSKVGKVLAWSILVGLFLFNLYVVTNNILHLTYQIEEINRVINLLKP